LLSSIGTKDARSGGKKKRLCKPVRREEESHVEGGRSGGKRSLSTRESSDTIREVRVQPLNVKRGGRRRLSAVVGKESGHREL